MTQPQVDKKLRREIAKILNEIVEREHLYHTTNYDGVVGVIREDVDKILALFATHTEQVREELAKRVAYELKYAKPDKEWLEQRAKWAESDILTALNGGGE